MDHPTDDDDCFSVQLDGSDMFPKASKVSIYASDRPSLLVLTCIPISNQTILRQRFTMRRYNLEHDGRLTNLVKTME